MSRHKLLSLSCSNRVEQSALSGNTLSYWPDNQTVRVGWSSRLAPSAMEVVALHPDGVLFAPADLKKSEPNNIQTSVLCGKTVQGCAKVH